MKQDLFVIPHEWLSIPVFGWGWLLMAWAIASVVLLAVQWRRHRSLGDVLQAVPMLMAVAVVIVVVLPWLEATTPAGQPIGLPIRGYGVMLLLAVLSGVGLAARQARQMGIHPDVIYSLAFWVFVGGIAGARSFYIVLYWDQFQRDSVWATIVAMLNVIPGGLVVYGSLIGALLAGGLFLRLRRLPVLALADLVTPSLLLGLALGRIGCLLNGCCFGGVCYQPGWSLRFPESSPPYAHQRAHGQLHGFHIAAAGEGDRPEVRAIEPGGPAESAGLEWGAVILAVDGRDVAEFAQTANQLSVAGPRLHLETDRGPVTISLDALPARSRPVHPVQLYSAINAALLSLLMWAWYPFRRRDGELFAALLVLYPITRFLLELIRADEPGRLQTDLTISQWVSCGLLVLAVGLWIYLIRQPAGSVLPRPATGSNPADSP